MGLVKTYYSDAYGDHPWNFYVDSSKWISLQTSSLYTADAETISDVIYGIGNILGAHVFDCAFPLVRGSYANTNEIMEVIKEIFPNSYYIDSPTFDGSWHEIPVEFGSNTQIDFALRYNISDNGTVEYGQIGNFGAIYGGTSMFPGSGLIGGRIEFTGYYPGEMNIRLQAVVPTEYFNESEMKFTSIIDSSNQPAGVNIRWYSHKTNQTNFWIYGRQTITHPDWFKNIKVDERPTPTPSGDDPYSPTGGYSTTGGGPAPTGGTGTTGNGGLHDDTSDAIPTPSTPSDVVISSGLFTAYNPDASQLSSFASALWNMQVSDINDVLRFLFGGDAFNAVIGLHLLPVAPSTGGSLSIKLGNWETGVSAPKISSQYKQVSFGSLLLPEYWGNCIDYAPYTKIQLALPYIGIVDVDTDDVLGSTNTLTYNIDVLSGAICATLHCVKFNLSSVIYQWSGACAVSLPFSGASYNSVLSAIAGVAAAGMGFAAMAAGPIGAALPATALAAGGGAFGAGSAASIMGTMKGKVQKSGSFGANSGALGIMTPYFILTRPVQSVPASWQADKGYPANISAQLGTLIGYTEVSEINLECSGTEAEKKEIIDLLKKGVLF